MSDKIRIGPAARLYAIQNDVYHYLTGHLGNGNQVLMMGDSSDSGLPSFPRVEFNTLGDVVAVHREEPANSTVTSALFTPGTIRVKAFFVPDIWFGIEDLPDHYQEFLDHPEKVGEEQYLGYPELIEDWRERKSFVLWCNEDYDVSEDGELESS